MQKAVVLGAGMVGREIARDLAEGGDLTVTLVDYSQANLAQAKSQCPDLQFLQADLSVSGTVRSIALQHDLVCGALASHLGLGALAAVIDAGKPYADISFMADDALALSGKAKDAGVTAIVDCGVAPGMSNMQAGWGYNALDTCERIEILVGGLPRKRKWPYEYKAGFAPADVIEEYTRESRIVENGQLVTRPALSEPELLEFEGVGTLEAFNTDGLRSLAYTLDVPDMIERTLRYPGHIEIMRIFRETGLFSKEPIEVNGVSVRPLDVTSALLFPKWTYEDGEEDLTVMRVTCDGVQDGKRQRHRFELLDFYSQDKQASSMSRTTALPCSIVASMLLDGRIHQPGVHAPEVLGQLPGLLEEVHAALAERGVHYSHSVRDL